MEELDCPRAASSQKCGDGVCVVGSAAVPAAFAAAVDLAIDHVTQFGDSYSLPPTAELAVIKERKEAVHALVADIYLAGGQAAPWGPVREVLMLPVGQSGYRAITQVDPVFNIYLLALVIAAAPDMERARLSVADGVHSFRFLQGSGSRLFDADVGWRSFANADRRLSSQYSHVATTDISGFSHGIRHVRLESALARSGVSPDLAKRIVRALAAVSGGAGIGLPVAGPATLMLGELVLDAADRMLRDTGVVFLRYIDDFRIYASTADEAQRALYSLTRHLWEEDGLMLQKGRTRLLPAERHLHDIPGGSVVDDSVQDDAGRLLAMPLWLEPHPGAGLNMDDALLQQIRGIDCVEVLRLELRRPRVRRPLMKRLIRLLEVLEPDARAAAIVLLAENLPRLGDHFQGVMQSIASLPVGVDDGPVARLAEAVAVLLGGDSHIAHVPSNQLWAVRMLADHMSPSVESTLLRLGEETSSAAVKGEVAAALVLAGRQHSAARLEPFGGATAARLAAVVAGQSLQADGRWESLVPAKLSRFERIVWRWSQCGQRYGRIRA